MRTLLIFCLLSLTVLGFGQAWKTTVKGVTVFQSGAQVEREATVNVDQGFNLVKLTGFSAQINPASLQVRAGDQASILSVALEADSLVNPDKLGELKSLNDSLRRVQGLLNTQLSKQKGLLAEEEMIRANKQLGGSTTGVKIADLKEGAAFFQQRIAEIGEALLAIDEKVKNYRYQVAQLTGRIGLVRAQATRPSTTLAVTVESKKKQSLDFGISYFSANCGWTPQYDLRANDISKPMELVFRARISQSSDEEWKNVDLKISTGNPTESGVAPVLIPWYFDLVAPVVVENLRRQKSNFMNQAPAMAGRAEVASEASYQFSPVVVTEAQTRMVYEIPVRYSVAPDGRPVTVEIWKKQLPATYRYYCVPRLETDVFLQASVTGWEDLGLVPGEAAIYFGNTFVGSSSIGFGDLSDTLALSLGRDPSIRVLREKIKDYSGGNLIGTTTKKTEGWEITIRNQKKQSIDMDVMDQFPLSANKDISIERIEWSKGQVNDQTGEVKWSVKLEPSESRKLKIQYTVSYPKNRKIRQYFTN